MAIALPMRRRTAAVLAVVALLNLAAGCAALFAPVGVAAAGLCSIAYLLGVRHAFDADHIAAIDNVTRRLRAEGRRPVGVGLLFSLGHSAVVLALTGAALVAAHGFDAMLPLLTAWGGVAGDAVSATFLTVVGVANLRFLLRLRRGSGDAGHAAQGGAIMRLVRRTGSSWAMFPLGVLFGLGFDTASEVALLALSIAAAHATQAPLWNAMLLPLMFTAGMALTDTLESLLMLRLYDWAIADRDRTLRLNTTVTAISVVLALGVAIQQWIGLALRPAHVAPLVAMPDSSAIGVLATALLLGLGVAAWLLRQRAPADARACSTIA